MLNPLSRSKHCLCYTAIIATIFLSSCATLTEDIEVEVHADSDINFNTYQTYAWAGSAQVVFDPIGQWEQPTLDTDEEVRFAINRELHTQGFYQVDTQPDMLVAFAAGIDTTVLALKKDPMNEVPTYAPKAALVIALIDASSGYVIWLGHATGDAQEQQSIENIRTRIDYAINKIFKQL